MIAHLAVKRYLQEYLKALRVGLFEFEHLKEKLLSCLYYQLASVCRTFPLLSHTQGFVIIPVVLLV